MDKIKLASLFLRVGLAFVFTYAAISSFFLPDAWFGFYPQFLMDNFPEQALLYSHAILEIVLAIWLLTGWKTFSAAILAAVWLLGIILGTFDLFLITFRDVAIFAGAAALAVLSEE